MALIFSISGVRGLVGSELTPQVAADVGCAFATVLGGGRVVLAADTRASGPMLCGAVAGGLMAAGCTVIDLGVVTTPGAALMVSLLEADGGVVVTGSHNPPAYNGIKLLSSNGRALPAELSQRVRQVWLRRAFTLAEADGVGRLERHSGTHERHVEAVLKIVDAAAIAARRLRVVLDSVNGAGCLATAMLLERLGCHVIQINGCPDGRFARPPEPVPENIAQLVGAVRQHDADVGFAQDPDGDRLAIVDQTGRCIGEEYTLALAARQVLSHRRGAVAANLSTSRLIDDVASAVDCTVHRTPVGEAHVVDAIVKHGCLIGGEGNGGVIDPRVVLVRDSLVAIALICQLLAETHKTISALVADLPAYAMIKQKFACSPERAARVLSAVRRAFASQRLNEADGLRIDLPDAWLHIRPSNTEPIMRLIAEAPSQHAAQELIERVARIAESVP